MKLSIFAIGATLMIFGSAVAASPDKGMVFAKSVAKTMDETLKDYPTARFRDVKIYVFSDGSGGKSCGYVNSKNSAGAYAGWTQFLVINQVLLLADDPAKASVISDECNKNNDNWLDQDYANVVKSR